MSIFDIENIAFTVLNYPVSYIELIGTIFGILAVWLSSRGKVLTWAAGIVNYFFLFFLFYQVRLYPDMFLQIYYLIFGMFGWYNWSKKSYQNQVFSLTLSARLIYITIIIASTILFGFFFLNIHNYFPDYFKEMGAGIAFIDSFILVLSVIANILLVQKKI
ncbi:nicotinamide mononucleotide transporter [Bacteroidia bacterium]|nr:nicotinamide mononucleotide transporter [Bacteroidia bacterium]